MPFTFNSDPQATAISPDLGQQPGLTPILSLPQDLETANVASIVPAIQILGNHVAWLKGPRAKANDVNTNVLSFKNSMGQVVSRVDPYGFLRPGRYYHEDFPINFSEHLNTGTDYLPFGMRASGVISNSSDPLPGWFYGLLNSAGATTPEFIALQDPYVSSGRIISPRRFMIQTPVAINNAAGIFRRAHYAFAKNAIFSLSFRISYILSAGPVVVGMASQGAGWFVGATDFSGGLYLKLDTPGGDTTWKFIARAVGGGASVVDTGMSPGIDGMRVRIVYRGSELDDASTTRGYLYLDNGTAFSVSTNLPANGEVFADFAAHAYTTMTSGFAPNSQIAVSDVEFQAHWLP